MYRFILPAALALIACSTEPIADEADRIDLQAVIGVGDLSVSGVSVDPDNASLVVSTAAQGVFRIVDGDATRVVSPMQIADAAMIEGRSPIVTDVAALPGGQIAMTIPGIGLLYTPGSDELTLHFCYEPGWGEWEVQHQETYSLAFDAGSNTLLSQPQTLTGETPDRADVAVFDVVSGEPLAWHTLEDASFVAGALAIGPDSVLLAVDSEVYDYDIGGERPVRRVDLSSLDVSNIEGLAVRGEELLVVDGATNTLHILTEW